MELFMAAEEIKVENWLFEMIKISQVLLRLRIHLFLHLSNNHSKNKVRNISPIQLKK